MDLRSWLSALGGAPAGGAAYGMAAPPVQSAQPMGLAVPPMARGTKLSAEMDYDGSHPRQQEQAARDHFRSYGPNMLMDALIPGYGAGGDAKAASEAFGEGRYGAAAGNAAMVAADFLPFLSVLPAAAKGIRAFHGSPHDFDRFDMSKIGTGEGNAMYGRGANFTESSEEAERYRNLLSMRRDGPPGKVFEVEIDADPLAFVDWASLTKEQKAAAQTPEGAKAMLASGIPGIRVDGSALPNGAAHYVVFDDRLITILRKYGIGGLIAGGGAYALTDAEYAQAAELLAQDGMNTGAQ